jgi:capsular exopolysaccharide synthesis family protein
VLIIGLGAFVGLAGGLGLAFLFDNLDTTLYSIEAIERVTHLITLAQIPQIKRRRKAQYITCLSNNSPQGEAFRRLRTNLLIPATRQDNLYQTLLMVSAEPAEGKSTIVANLAQSVAQSGRKVVAIDADMRLPTLHEILELPNKIGLSNVLRQEVPLSEALQQAPNLNLHVLTSGPIPSDPAELLDSCNLIALIDQLRDQFDLILIDSPALLAVADASILASVVDKVALVARRTKIKAEALAEACHQLETINAPMMGVIVNQSEMQRHYTYYYRKPALSN